MSNNIIPLTESIPFGRYKGCKGIELLKSADGVDYLKWCYINTDIPMDSHIVNTLISKGVVFRISNRTNSRLPADAQPVRIMPGGNLSQIYKKTDFHEKLENEQKEVIQPNINVHVKLSELREHLSKPDIMQADINFRKAVEQLQKDIIHSQLRERLKAEFPSACLYNAMDD